MTDTKIKIGVLGCANIAKRSVIPAIKELRDTFELVAIASRTKEKATVFADLFDCEPICGYQNLIDRKDVSALYIPLPTGLHKEWILKALQAGKHVYAEKSIAFNYQDADEMVNLASANNLALQEGYMFIYHAQHKIIIDLINNGEIGEIRSFRSLFGFPPLDKDNFRYDTNLGGGVVFDAAGYPLRVAHLILGPGLAVTSSSLQYSPLTNTALYGNAFLQNKEGATAHIAFGFDNFYQCNYEIWGSKGKLTATKAFTPKVDEQPEIIVETANGIRLILAPADNHFRKALQEFANSITDVALRQTQYAAILRQSSALDRIIELSKNS
jgi:NDP-hexose-3-ketoreductase